MVKELARERELSLKVCRKFELSALSILAKCLLKHADIPFRGSLSLYSLARRVVVAAAKGQQQQQQQFLFLLLFSSRDIFCAAGEREVRFASLFFSHLFRPTSSAFVPRERDYPSE